MRKVAMVVGAVLALSGAFAGGALADPGVTATPMTLTVPGPNGHGTFAVGGTMYQPAGSTPKTALLLVHGLSYGQWAWDFPYNNYQYSIVRPLAEAGYAALAIDVPGYGTSNHGDGRAMTVQFDAKAVASIGKQLHADGFSKVGIIGHSAGSEISELAVATNPHVFNALIATSYTHEPSVQLMSEVYTGDLLRALQSPFEYFEGTPAQRDAAFYTGAFDPAVVPIDNSMAELTPSGEITSIAIPPQPSRLLTLGIKIPLLLVLGDKDALFPPADNPVPLLNNVQIELAQFGSKDKSALIAQDAGHLFFLEKSAPQTLAGMIAWLEQRLPPA